MHIHTFYVMESAQHIIQNEKFIQILEFFLILSGYILLYIKPFNTEANNNKKNELLI